MSVYLLRTIRTNKQTISVILKILYKSRIFVPCSLKFQKIFEKFVPTIGARLLFSIFYFLFIIFAKIKSGQPHQYRAPLEKK